MGNEDLENLEQTKGPQFFNAHLIWKKIVVAEVASKALYTYSKRLVIGWASCTDIEASV
jgi:hypothetical protein